MARFILVPGGWHGAWAFEAVSSNFSGVEFSYAQIAGLDRVQSAQNSKMLDALSLTLPMGLPTVTRTLTSGARPSFDHDVGLRHDRRRR